MTRRHGTAGLALAALAFAAGCGRGKEVENVPLSPEQRYERAMDLLARRELRAALADLGRIDQYAAADRSALEPLVRLATADATFYQVSDLALIDARALYLDFVTLYGDHPRAPYAQFQAGLCSLRQVSGPSRDQGQTLQAIEDLREVERRYPASPYATAARVMRGHAEENLAEHEFLIGRFYAGRKKHLAAAERFRTVIDRFPTYRQRDKVYYHLGRALLALDNRAEAEVYLSKLVRDFPEGRYTEPATKLLGGGAQAGDGTADGSP